eukprot:g4658.t1
MGLLRRVSAIVALTSVLVMFVPSYLVQKRFPVPSGEGNAVLITGSSTGIGRHAAVYLAERGFVVYAGVRKESDEKSLNELKLKNLRPIRIDVTSTSSILEAKRIIESESQNLVGLVNNAGINKELPIEVQRLENMRKVFDVNVFGLVEVTQAFLPMLKQHAGSRIINIGSVAGSIAVPMKGTYAASKHALEALSDAMRMELSRFDVSVSLIKPAYVRSKIAEKQVGANAVFRQQLSREEYEMYRHIFDTFELKRMQSELKASSPLVTSEAIWHALTNEYPKTRYVVANVNGIPAQLVVPLLSILPDRLIDMILGHR